MLLRSSLIATAILLPGCGSMTRVDYERSNGLPVMAEHVVTEADDLSRAKVGDVVVVYGPDLDPRIDFAGTYTCPEGVRVAIYRDGTLVKRWFQKSEVTK